MIKGKLQNHILDVAKKMKDEKTMVKNETNSDSSYDDSSEYSDSSDDSETDDESETMYAITDTEDLKKFSNEAHDAVKKMNKIDKEIFLTEYFQSEDSRYSNYNSMNLEKKMKLIWIAPELFKKNIEKIRYLKDKIYTYNCPVKPAFKRKPKDLGNISLNTIIELEEVMEIFSGLYSELLDLVPSELHMSMNMQLSEKKLLSEDVLKKFRKRSNLVRDVFSQIDMKYGHLSVDFSKMQCDLKDFMNFYMTLPRFISVYKKCEASFSDQSDAYMKFAVKRLRNLSYTWRKSMKSLFKNFHFINFFIVYTKMFFDLVLLVDDSLDILEPLDVFLNIYNLNNYTFSKISQKRKIMLEAFQELKEVFIMIENNKNLVSMPFPEFEKFPELFEKVSVSCTFVLLAMLSALFFRIEF